MSCQQHAARSFFKLYVVVSALWLDCLAPLGLVWLPACLQSHHLFPPDPWVLLRLCPCLLWGCLKFCHCGFPSVGRLICPRYPWGGRGVTVGLTGHVPLRRVSGGKPVCLPASTPLCGCCLSFTSKCVIRTSYSAVLLLAAGVVAFKENYRKKTSLIFATSSATPQALPSCLPSDPGFCRQVFQPEQLPLFPLVTHDCWWGILLAFVDLKNGFPLPSPLKVIFTSYWILGLWIFSL